MPSRARRYGGSVLMSWPWKVILPERNGSRPMMLSMVVVLPAPLRPTRTTDSLSPTSSETCRRIWARPRYVWMACSSSMGRPEHCILHRLVAADLLRGAAGEDHALVHDDDAVGVLEDDVHVVLDDDRGDPVRPDDGGDHVHDRRLLTRADAAGRLVEEEQPRLERVGNGHVEQLALSLGDAAGEVLRFQIQPEVVEDVVRFVPDRSVVIRQREEPAGLSLAGKDGQRHVVDDRQLVEEVDDLEAPGDAALDAVLHRLASDVLAAEEDLAAVGLQESADQVDQARLARAVGADQRDDLALADLEVDLVDGMGFAEVLGQLRRLQVIHWANRLLAAAASSLAVPTIPVGSATTSTTRTIPSSACQYTVKPTAYVFR